MHQLLTIVYEDAHLLVLNKPAGLVCHPTKGDALSSLISRARLYLGTAQGPHLVNRLDRETSGLVLVAKDPQTAGELGSMVEQRSFEKRYLAIVWRHVRPDAGVIDARLGRDTSSEVVIKDCVRADGVVASTAYHVLHRFTWNEQDFSLLQLQPLTGRKHQIRIHLAHLGHPVVGDKLYGHDPRVYLDFVQGRLNEAQMKALLLPNHALHASQIQFAWRGETWRYSARPEPPFEQFLAMGLPAYAINECSSMEVPAP